MMHVMQPVVLDSDWSANHRTLDTNCTLASSVTLDRPAAANLSSPGVNDATQAISTSAASFNAPLNHADVCHVQPPSAQHSTDSALANQSMTTSTTPLKPPKKPLTPYMRFSQAVWREVKKANPDHSVCQLGSLIGRMWRQLTDNDKQPYFDSFTDAKAEYEKEVQAYMDANGLKPSDLIKPKVRKKEIKKHQSQVTGEIQQQNAANQQVFPTCAATASNKYQAARPADDDLLVYHVRADGTQECYVQRGVGEMKAAAAEGGQLSEREMLLSTLAEQTHNVTQLRLQMMNCRSRIIELEQQNELLRQLLRDAQLSARQTGSTGWRNN